MVRTECGHNGAGALCTTYDHLWNKQADKSLASEKVAMVGNVPIQQSNLGTHAMTSWKSQATWYNKETMPADSKKSHRMLNRMFS